MESKFYLLTAKSLRGDDVEFEQFKGKIVLVVNTASKCGLTPQYKGLEELYKKYKDRGLVVLGFPCNQFANQEPGDEKGISETCLINYGVTFPMFAKIEVNGSNTHPVFTYLKSQLSGWFGRSIKWNFTKFLIDANGKPVRRFSPLTKPQKIEAHILKLVNKQAHSQEF